MGEVHEMSIESWGPKIWSILHITSFAYPDEPTRHDKYTMYNFYHSLKHLLPCPRCKKHFMESLHRHMNHAECATLQSKRNLSSYVVDLHNEVNERNGKELWDYERAKAHYCADRSGVCSIITPVHVQPPSGAAARGGGWPRKCLGVAVVFAVVLALALLVARRQKHRNERDITGALAK